MNEIITKLDEIEKKANDMISDAKNLERGDGSRIREG